MWLPEGSLGTPVVHPVLDDARCPFRVFPDETLDLARRVMRRVALLRHASGGRRRQIHRLADGIIGGRLVRLHAALARGQHNKAEQGRDQAKPAKFEKVGLRQAAAGAFGENERLDLQAVALGVEARGRGEDQFDALT